MRCCFLICLIRLIFPTITLLHHQLCFIMKPLCCFYSAEDSTGTHLLSVRIYYFGWGKTPECEILRGHASVSCKSRLALCFCNYSNGPLRHSENWGGVCVFMCSFLSVFLSSAVLSVLILPCTDACFVGICEWQTHRGKISPKSPLHLLLASYWSG